MKILAVLVCTALVLELRVTPVHAAEPSAASRGNHGTQLAVLAPSMLEDAGLTVGTITIANGGIFDLDNPKENRFLYRLAERLHIRTRPEVIRTQLLFAPGDEFSTQSLEETERLLRSKRYIQDVSIIPVRAADGSVDITVATSDTWTLNPKVSFSRSGGTSDYAVGLKEMNLLGTGIAVEALFESDIDRDTRVLKVSDRNIGNSWWGADGVFADSSDGHTVYLRLAQPFYSLDTRSTKGVSYLDNDEVDSFYDAGHSVSKYRQQTRRAEIMAGWSGGLVDGWARRFTYGLVADEHRFSAVLDDRGQPGIVPADRTLVYPFFGIEIVEDDYLTSRNLEQIHRTEDVFMGWKLNGRVGLASEALGSDRNALVVSLAAQTAYGTPGDRVLLLRSELQGRAEQGGDARDLVLSSTATYYRRQSEHRLLFASLSATLGRNLDLDNVLVTGGDSGLRGYPIRYQSGDRRAVFTLEQRIYTDWQPLRLFQVGAAVFFDAGRAWGNSPVARSSNEWLRNVGFGLRIGSSRSGLGRMIHLDVAMPLDGGDDIDSVQFLVSTKKRF